MANDDAVAGEVDTAARLERFNLLRDKRDGSLGVCSCKQSLELDQKATAASNSAAVCQRNYIATLFVTTSYFGFKTQNLKCDCTFRIQNLFKIVIVS